MAYCPNCGTQVPDHAAFCTACGSPMMQRSAAPGNGYWQSYDQQAYYPPVRPYETGGLMAWSIITLLLCTIPGIVALVKTSGINNALTTEEQARRIRSAKTWCWIGTIGAVLAGILSIIFSVLGFLLV